MPKTAGKVDWASALAEAFSHFELREKAKMIAIEVQHVLGRARDFLEGMETFVDEGAYILGEDVVQFRHSPALLGIHCAISYCDALRIGLGSSKVSSENHGSATEDLKRCLKGKIENLRGTEHLGDLLAKKSRIAYSPTTVRENEVEEIVKHAQRFALWAEETGKKLKIEGWGDD